jgi:hypothetical protein
LQEALFFRPLGIRSAEIVGEALGMSTLEYVIAAHRVGRFRGCAQPGGLLLPPTR